MLSKVIAAVERFSMFSKGDSVTVALSGGADSMALLDILYKNRKKWGITVSAAHLNHKLRGNESDRDEEFVHEYCKKLGIMLLVESIDVGHYSKVSGKGTEEAARELRYGFLSRVAEGKIATAHTASDNAETLLINLLRGTALKGACGIPPTRDNFIRPLIFCTRAEVEEYCEQNSVPFVTDSTNLSNDYTRNKIRHNIIPAMREINPSLEDAVTRFTLSAGEDSALLEQLSVKELEKSVKGDVLTVDSRSPSVAKRMIAAFLEAQTGHAADSCHINGIYEALGTKTNRSVAGGKTAYINGFKVSLEADEPNCFEPFMETVEGDELLKVNKLLLNNAADCDKICGKVCLRTRIEGDSIKLAGRGTKSLKKLYNEMHVPPQDRDVLPVAEDEGGVIWVCGAGVSERVCVTSKTKKAIIFKIKNS